MVKWTNQQKLLNVCAIMGSTVALGIMLNVLKIGPQNASEILKLATEIGPEKAINVLQKAQKVVNIAA